jgi:hypothetical protein
MSVTFTASFRRATRGAELRCLLGSTPLALRDSPQWVFAIFAGTEDAT